jgi:8-oxo-dGTP diphosphatase
MKPSSKALVIHNNKLLLFLRDNKPHITDPNKWNLLGGTIEEGEDAIFALKRELKEEANINALNITKIGELDTWNGKNYMYIVRINNLDKENIRLGDEGQKLQFFTFAELKNIELSRNLDTFIGEYSDLVKCLLEKGEDFNLSST